MKYLIEDLFSLHTTIYYRNYLGLFLAIGLFFHFKFVLYMKKERCTLKADKGPRPITSYYRSLAIKKKWRIVLNELNDNFWWNSRDCKPQTVKAQFSALPQAHLNVQKRAKKYRNLRC